MIDTSFNPEKSREEILREFESKGGSIIDPNPPAVAPVVTDETVMGYTNYKKRPWDTGAVEIAPHVYVDRLPEAKSADGAH